MGKDLKGKELGEGLRQRKDKDMVFLSGTSEANNAVNKKLPDLLNIHNNVDLAKLQSYLRETFPKEKSKIISYGYHDVNAMVLTVQNNTAYAYDFNQEIDFIPQCNKAPKGEVQLIVNGIYGQKIYNEAFRFFNNSTNFAYRKPESYIEIYSNIYSEAVGGYIQVYEMDRKGVKLLQETQLEEHDLEYVFIEESTGRQYVEKSKGFDANLMAATGTFAGAVTAGQVIGSEITGSTMTASTITGSDINGSRFTSFGYRNGIPQKTLIDNGYITSNYMKVKPMNETTNDFSDDSAGYTFIGAKQIGIYHNGAFPLLITNGDIICTSIETTSSLKADNIISNKFNGVSVLGDIITSFNKSNYSFNPEFHRHDTLYNDSLQTAFFSSSGNFANRNGGDLGSPTYRWGTGYFASAPSVTSDRVMKHDIEELPEIYKKLILKLKPVRFKYNDGSSDRFHTGFISQDVETALFELGIDTKDFGGFVKHPVYEKINEFGEYDVNSPITGYLYMLRSEEFISPAISVIQQLDQRINDLEQKLAKI
ncbi:tail fiber domain-containing protein [Clostridium sp. KNHs205]|uniref:tail fiber domain-containing protein n=1 Tax=Clostridium sp. KNHs205 TaxID=1449050 RepID=UPI00051AEAEA|nr:tail fiber domain-containing protein [Clostridium sp. KNHs205]